MVKDDEKCCLVQWFKLKTDKQKTVPFKKRRWKLVENVVTAIESVTNAGLKDLKVTSRAMVPMKSDPTLRREVDVLVEFTAGNRTIRIGVETKNEKYPLDVTKLGGLYEKHQELITDRLVVVSTSGFAKKAAGIYRSKGVELLLLDEVESFRWAELTHMQVFGRLFRILGFQAKWEGTVDLPSKGSLDEFKVCGLEDGQEMSLVHYIAAQMGRAVPLDPEALGSNPRLSP